MGSGSVGVREKMGLAKWAGGRGVGTMNCMYAIGGKTKADSKRTKKRWKSIDRPGRQTDGRTGGMSLDWRSCGDVEYK